VPAALVVLLQRHDAFDAQGAFGASVLVDSGAYYLPLHRRSWAGGEGGSPTCDLTLRARIALIERIPIEHRFGG